MKYPAAGLGGGRSLAIFVLIAFAISFFLPVYNNSALSGPGTLGWEVARDTFHDTIHPTSGGSLADQVNTWVAIPLFDLANLLTPAILVMLLLKGLRGLIPLYLLIILALAAANAFRLAGEQLLVGYWVWLACQVFALVLGIWNHRLQRQMRSNSG